MLISGTTGIDLTGLPINNSGNTEVEGNLNLSGTSIVQPNTIDTNMVFKVSPSGTANFSSIIGYGSSGISNTHFGQIAVRSDSVTIDSSKTVTGTFKPLKIGIGGGYPIVIDEGNNLSLGTGAQAVKVVLPDTGEMTVRPLTTASNVKISATASDYSSLPSWMSTSLLQYGSTASGNYITGVPKANLGALWGQNITNLVIGSNISSPIVFVNNSSEKMRIDASGNLLLTSGTGGLGYGTGAGGQVTQLTSKTTAVTLNKPTGQIIMNNAALAAGALTGFTFSNSLLSYTDTVVIGVNGTLATYYTVTAGYYTSGACVIYVTNRDTGSRSEAVVLNYTIIKGAIA